MTLTDIAAKLAELTSLVTALNSEAPDVPALVLEEEPEPKQKAKHNGPFISVRSDGRVQVPKQWRHALPDTPYVLFASDAEHVYIVPFCRYYRTFWNEHHAYSEALRLRLEGNGTNAQYRGQIGRFLSDLGISGPRSTMHIPLFEYTSRPGCWIADFSPLVGR